MQEERLQNNIKEYNLHYRKAVWWDRGIILVLLVFIAIVTMCGFLAYLLHHLVYLIFFFTVIFVTSFFRLAYSMRSFNKASGDMVDDYIEREDFIGCLAFLKEISTYTKHKKDRTFVILQYMNLCFMLGRYEELEEIYNKYKKDVFSPFYLKTCEKNVLTFAAMLSQPNQLYEELYQKRKPMKFKQTLNLSTTKQILYNHEMSIQAGYAYHHKHYEEALAYLTDVKPLHTSERLSMNHSYVKNYIKLSRREDAILYIERIKQESDAYAIVRNLPYILEGREEEMPRVSATFVETFASDLQAYTRKFRKKQKILRVLTLIFLVLFIVSMMNIKNKVPLEPYTNLYNTIHQLDDYDAIGEYGTFDVNGEHVGLMHLKMVSEDQDKDDPLQGFMSIATYGIVEVVEKNNVIQSIIMNDNKVFTFEDQTYLEHPLKDHIHTYVVIEGNLKNLIYDGEVISDIKHEEIVGLLKDDIHTLTCFLIQSQSFDMNKLDYDLS